MKFISTIGFLIAYALNMYVGVKQQQRMIRKLRSKNTGIVSYGFAMLGLLLIFVQFWCLTGIFPYYVILLLVGASFIGVMIHNLIGAFAGFGVEENKSKINILVLAFAAQRKAAGAAVLIGAFVLLVVVPVGSLYKFWKLPVGSSEAVAWIAFFLFIIPQIFSILLGFASILPTITSEYVDNDVRNYLLSTQFSSVINSTVALTFPVWVFTKFPSTINQWMPPGWLILSIPSLIFLFCYLLPYFVGASRYRFQLKAQLEWRREWLKETEEVLTLPEASRISHIQEKNTVLDAKVTERIEANELNKYLRDLESSISGVTTEELSQNPGVQILKLIYDNRENLQEWDIRYREIDKLQHLSNTVSQTGSGDLSGFIASAKTHVTDDIAALSKERSVLAGGMWTVLTFLGPLVFKAYQDPIVALIGKLFRH